MPRSLLLVLAVVSLLTSPLPAQGSLGHIHGVVRDATGTPLSGADVALTGPSSFRRVTISDGNGEFWFRDLGPGRYTVTVRLSGFSTANMAAVVSVGFTRELVVTLKPGRLEENSLDRVAPKVDAPARGGIAGGLATASPFGAGEFNTEAYDKIDDNGWFEVGRKPLSTFSTDVDTASYANVRRFLKLGQMPPRDAVRIEELINYFSYDYPEPREDKPFAVTTALGECPWNPRHRLALIGLQARRIDSSSTPPRNLVFLIDVSGSMASPNKLPLVKASLAMLARNLTADDRIAIVVYAGAAGLVLPSTSGSDSMTVLEALGRLEAGGSTNGAQGIRLAYELARKHFIAEGVNRVVLATDGDFNVGVTNQGDLIRLIEENREHGVSLTVLGFGMGNLKDSTLEKLADRGNGNYSYIDSLSEAQKVLVEEAGGTLVTVAKDVKLQVEFNPRLVAAYRLIGYENRLLQDRDFNDDKKDAGDIGAGHSVTALYELVPVGVPLDVPGIDPLKYQQPGVLSSDAGRDEAMTIKLRYKAPSGSQSSLMVVPVVYRTAATPALEFAAAVAEFGMLLRDSEFKGASSYSQAAMRAARHTGEDLHGHRAELVRLINIAETVSRLAQTSRR
jgi:Ca-activated chloride channel family protein